MPGAAICPAATAPRACRRICIGARSRRARSGMRCAPTVTATAHETFLKELGWREFCAQLLFHNPDLPDPAARQALRQIFMARAAKRISRPGRSGQTGIPIVDAGMRQLWQTGWMHNRVRMIVASFLIKHLGIHWREASLVLGHAGRCRSRQQRRQLAMGGRLRRRRRALLPHLQSGAAGREIRSRRRLCPQIRAGTGKSARQIYPQAMGGAHAAAQLPLAHRGFGAKAGRALAPSGFRALKALRPGV